MELGTDIIFNVSFVIIVSTVTFLLIYFKNNPISRKKVFDYSYLVKLIMYMLPFIAVVGVVTPLIVGLSNLALLGIYMAVPMIVGPLIYYQYFYKYLNNDDFKLEGV